MKRSSYKTKRILLSVILLLLICNLINAQGNMLRETSSAEKTQLEQKTLKETEDKQNVKEEISSQKINSEENKDKKKKKEGDSISGKKVKKTDTGISGSKGARPPYISRPSGSTISRGSGRPGGSIRPGRR